MMKKIRGLFLSFLLLLISISAFSQHKTMISGKVLSTEKTTVDFATVYLKGTNYGFFLGFFGATAAIIHDAYRE